MQFFFSVFLSAFLVFQIQPIISKVILPWFGGGSGVWTTCILFFQFFLLCGYLYAFLLTKYLKVKYQLIVHPIFLVASLFLLPSSLNEVQSIPLEGTPIVGVLKVLFFAVGLPFFALSANTPLMQHWFSNVTNGPNPYRLYAISNVGSFLALLSYPFVVEPFLSLDSQLFLWSGIFCLFALIVASICLSIFKDCIKKNLSFKKPLEVSNISYIKLTLWFMLSALGVVLLISTTNALTQNVPPVPFLWLAPLALYLLTYVLAFSQLGLYVRRVWLPSFMILSFVGILVYFIGGQFDVITQLAIYLLILLSGCMVCHGELNLLKPKQGNTTLFYLIISAGGVFGSFLVSVAAVRVFDDFMEFPLAIFSVLVLSTALLGINKQDKEASIRGNAVFGLANVKSKLLPITCATVAVVWLIVFVKLTNQYQQYDIATARNFYGILSVKDVTEGTVSERRLVDGTTSHGSQSLPISGNTLPLSYYRPGTGAQMVIEELSKQGQVEVGIIGLGVGALAAYGQAGDHYTFYEVNPLVTDLALRYFSFLDETEAKVSIKLGDARVTLQDELVLKQYNAFDILVVDAFSGDLIPTHLMTAEAFDLYRQHIKNHGVLALHISNRHLSLMPVVLGHSLALNMQIMLFETKGGRNEHDAQWVILTNNSKLLDSPKLSASQTLIMDGRYEEVVWTDDYSSLLPILKVLN